MLALCLMFDMKFESSCILPFETSLCPLKFGLTIILIVLFCRCREKQRKEASRLQTVNRKLSAMNKLLMEENDRLQKQVSHLVYENGFMRQQIQTVR